MLSIAPKPGGGSVQPKPAQQAKPAPRPTEVPAQKPVAAFTRPEENRTAARRPASAVPSITGVRFSPHGVEATLMNISESGILAECGERLKPGTALTVVFEGTFEPRTVEGRVARNSVSAMGADGRLRYHVGIAFKQPIDLPEIEPAAAPGPVAVAAPVPAARAEQQGPAVVAAHVIRNRW